MGTKREGYEDQEEDIEDLLCETDKFTVLLYYHHIKKGDIRIGQKWPTNIYNYENSKEKLIRKDDWDNLPMSLFDMLDSMLSRFLNDDEEMERLSSQGGTPQMTYITDDEDYNTALKLVCREVFFRDTEADMQEAGERAKEYLPQAFQVMESFIDLCMYLMLMRTKFKCDNIGLDLKEAKRLNPVTTEIKDLTEDHKQWIWQQSQGQVMVPDFIVEMSFDKLDDSHKKPARDDSSDSMFG